MAVDGIEDTYSSVHVVPSSPNLENLVSKCIDIQHEDAIQLC